MNTETTSEHAVLLVALANLSESKLNPRTTFPADYIAELSQSIKQEGVLTPLLVRPAYCIGTTTKKELEAKVSAMFSAERQPAAFDYEIVSGACRYRAAKAAKVQSVPVIVKKLTDPHLVELNLIEQLQHNQLTPIEEAASFKQMLGFKADDGNGQRHTVASLAITISKSELYVYERLKLLDLPEVAAKALLAGKIGTRVATAIARIPDKEARAAATKEILKGNDGEAMTKRQVEEYISRNHMRELKGAPFDQEDASLLQADAKFGCNGKCSTCLLRTGNNRAAFGDVKRGDICTQPACYEAKAGATLTRAVEKAKAEGKRVLTPSESAQIFPQHMAVGQVAYNATLVLLDSKPDAYLLKNVVKNVPTWRELLETIKQKILKVEVKGKDDVTVKVDVKNDICPPIYAVNDQGGRLQDMVQRDLVIAAADKAGEPIFKGKNEPRTPEDAEFKKRQKQEADESKIRSLVALAALSEFRTALVKKMEPSPLWAALQLAAFDALGGEGAMFLGKWQGFKLTGAFGWAEIVQAWYKKLPDAEQQALVPLILVAEKMRWHGVKSAGVAELAAWLKVDLKELEKGVRADSKKTKVKAPKKTKGKPKPETTTPAKPKAGAKPAKKKNAGSKAIAAVRASMTVKKIGDK